MPETPLPPDYVPFKKLKVCGNTMINGSVPISVHGNPVFLIGKGKKPIIWLYALTDTGWQPLVRASRSLHSEVRILSPAPMTWQVSVKKDIVLEVFVQGEDMAEITRLNLRPLGIEVYGDQLGLEVGTHRLSNNVFSNVHAMIAFDARASGPKAQSPST